MMTESDAYRLLGVSRDSTSAEVRAAFRKRLMQQHPDTAGEDKDESSVQDLVDAYRTISGSDPPVPGGEQSGTSGVRVRHVRRGSASTGTGEASCPACGGTGSKLETATCPDCLGSARLTDIGLERARVRWCPSCRGRGERRELTECTSCDGGGTIRGGGIV